MSFYEKIRRLRWKEIEKQITSCTPADVARALGARSLGMDGFISLLSPAAEQAMEEMAQRAQRLTQQRFGRVISLFAPLYLSNECTNACVYCGFNVHNTVDRLTITAEQAEAEASFLYSHGFRHILLVSGEAPQAVTMEYLTQILQKLRPSFSSISIELYPMPTADYQTLISNGVDGLIVYQETYNEKSYRNVHPSGSKSNYRWRLETPERGGEAGFRRIGIGALLGLNNWRVEGFFLALHARYLLRNFWKSHITVSFPRLRPAAGEFKPPYPVSDAQLLQFITALRLLLPDAGLVLSTREPAYLRDNLIPVGITSMSAGSCTAPGGYAHEVKAEAQFDIADHRSPEAVAKIIKEKGYDPVWKDWDAAFLQ